MISANTDPRPSNIESTDRLVRVMRRIVADNEGIDRADAIKEFLAEVRADDDLHDESDRYTAVALWNRCRPRDETAKDEREQALEENVRRVKETIAAEIILWTWRLPTNNKPLRDCTFAEVGEAAPLAGQFLAKLATQGAPGSLVREVFRTKEELQGFWAEAQK